MFWERPSRLRFLFSSLVFFLSAAPSLAFDPYLSPRLGISLTTLQSALEKVDGPVVFVPRAGSQQGTQEARLAGNAGIVQAGSDTANLAAVVVWLPVDARGKLASAKSQAYLDAFIRLFLAESEEATRWIEGVLKRALAEAGNDPYIESHLYDKHQFKATYMPTLSPPMLSLTVTSAEESGVQ
jgi:hypothetical protein